MPRNATRDCSYLAALAIAAFILAGCTPGIGDRCTLSTDCSVQGNRLCDTSQPNGYCTLTPCTANSCPDNAACVEIGASVPGCAYDDYAAPSRVGTSMCLKTCNSDSDCRQSDGYSCASPSGPGSSNVVLDTNQSERVCLIVSLVDGSGNPPGGFLDAQVCSSGRLDASPLEASASMLGESEASADGGVEDAGTAALDAAQDGMFDATADSAGDDGDVDSALGVDTKTDSTVDDGGADSTVGDSAGE